MHSTPSNVMECLLPLFDRLVSSCPGDILKTNHFSYLFMNNMDH